MVFLLQVLAIQHLGIKKYWTSPKSPSERPHRRVRSAPMAWERLKIQWNVTSLAPQPTNLGLSGSRLRSGRNPIRVVGHAICMYTSSLAPRDAATSLVYDIQSLYTLFPSATAFF